MAATLGEESCGASVSPAESCDVAVVDGYCFRVVDADATAGRCRLQRGACLTAEIDGVCIADQMTLENGETLVFLTDDCPYEEGLHAYLLDRDGGVVDAIDAGAPFASGVFRVLRRCGDSIEFVFFLNEMHYRLEIADKAKFRFGLPTGWSFQRPWIRHRLFVRTIPVGDV